LNLLDLYAKITLDTGDYEKGLSKAQKTSSEYKSDVMKLAQTYKSQGMSMSDAMKKAYTEIDKSQYETSENAKKSAGIFGESWKGAERSVDSLAGKLKSGLATAAKVGAAALTAAATGVAALTKASIDQYAEYEQLVGGVDTLFKSASDKVQQYADKAYETAGMSANEYMNTVTSFSASLLQSLEGDTEAAAQKADQAITDMADNANKMGTSVEMIQNAYQGFAKQNYTMLDNLKLGYGGTKEEMQRLLEDAEKLSGIKYDISSYADIVDAIHMVQTEMGITGTTAREASTTIQGSVASMKGAWKNLVTAIAADGWDIGVYVDNFVSSVKVVGQNVIPRVQQILSGIGELVTAIAPMIAQELPTLISTVLPAMVSAGAQLLVGLVTGLITALPDLVAAVPQIVSALASAIAANLPAIMAAGQQLLTMFGSGIQSGVPQMVAQLPVVIDGFLGFITERLPAVLDKGVEMLTELANGIISGIPQLAERLPLIIESFVTFITDNLPVILDAGVKLLFNLANGIIAGIPDMVSQLPKIIKSITTTISDNFPKIIRAGFDLLIKLADGILSAIPDLVSVLPQVVAAILSGFSSVVSGVFEIGKNIVMGLWDGIKSMGSWIAEKIGDFLGGIVDGAKDLLGIRSPSRVFADIGKNMALGLGDGWEDSFGRVRDGITRGLDFGAASVDFASSGLGVSSAGIINSMAAGADAGLSDGLTVNLTLPDGTKFATWQLPYLIKAGSAAGTPIADPQWA
jgi:phage-related protein